MPLLFANPEDRASRVEHVEYVLVLNKWVTAGYHLFLSKLSLAFLLKQLGSNISSEISFLPVIVVDILRIDTITCYLLFFKSFRPVT